MTGSASQTIEVVRTSDVFEQAESVKKAPVVGQHQPRQSQKKTAASQAKNESKIMQILLADRSQPTSTVLEKLKTENPYAPSSYHAKKQQTIDEKK